VSGFAANAFPDLNLLAGAMIVPGPIPPSLLHAA
jgi:hypothetical protein